MRVRRLPDRCHSSCIENLSTFGDGRFAFAAELANAVHAPPIPRRHGVTQCRLSHRHGGRYARRPAAVTSVMFTDAKPMPAVTAKRKVIAHTAHPAREVARWRVCQSPAAHDGMTSATTWAATPMAKNSHPAMSLDPAIGKRAVRGDAIQRARMQRPPRGSRRRLV